MRVLYFSATYLFGTTVLYFPVTLVCGYVSYADTLVTIFPNDSLLNVYYFWWINIHYVLLFTSTLLVCLLFARKRPPVAIVAALVLFLFEIWHSELRALLQSNAQPNSLDTLVSSANLLLTNALNKYHPLIFYSSLLLLLVNYGNLSLYSLQVRLFAEPLSINFLNNSRNPVLILNFTALFLGSWWALQEGTWGGWWNWDASELFGLTPTLAVLKLLHSRQLLRNSWVYLHHALTYCICALISYLLIQLNFELIAHNFGPKFFFFFNSNLASSLLLLTASCLLLMLVFAHRHLPHALALQLGTTKPVRRDQTPHGRSYVVITPFVIILLWFVLSFWNFFELIFSFVSQAGLWSTFSFYRTGLVLCVSLALVSLSFVQASPSVVSTSCVLPLFETVASKPASKRLHVVVLIFSVLNLLVHELTLYQWSYRLDSHNLDYAPNLLWRSSSLLICDSWNVDSSSHYFTRYSTLTTTWSTASTTNVETVNVFTLLLSPSAVINYYALTASYSPASLHMWLPSLPTIALSAFWAASFFFKKTS